MIDGDTIDVLIKGKIYRIRLLGVNCPETTAEKNKPYEYDSITDLNYLAKWGLKSKERFMSWHCRCNLSYRFHYLRRRY